MSGPRPPIGVGLLGAGFIAGVHAASLRDYRHAELRAIADPDRERATAFAREFDLPACYNSHTALLEDPSIALVIICAPNALHYPLCIDALNQGKHVLVEKPLAFSLEQAREMVALAQQRGLVLAYGEQLCYLPKFVRAKELALDRDAMGEIYHLRLAFKTSGPDSAWYRSKQQIGGGVTMDLACHAIECCRWVKQKIPVRSVSAHLANIDRERFPDLDDFSLIQLEFADGSVAQCESSWLHAGGEETQLEIFGTRGHIQADLWKGMGIRAYTQHTWAQEWEPNSGWIFPSWEWIWNSGYPQQDQHVIDVLLNGGSVTESGADGLAVLEIMLAAYHSAATGQKVALPFQPQDVLLPIDLWTPPAHGRRA